VSKTLEQAMREKAEELRGQPIVERTPGEKRAYRQAYEAGARDALRLVERFGSVAKATEDIEHLLRALDAAAGLHGKGQRDGS
jgi:hypothetical protein